MIRARAPHGERRLPRADASPEAMGRWLEDAAHFRGGHSTVAYYPESEAEVAAILAHHDAVLPVGAQSSLTGGATPFGEAVISTARLDGFELVASGLVRAGAGVVLSDLEGALSRAGAHYPPTPTFLGATVGGVVSTNAAGAATFKYGSTRSWVQAITVILASGDVLDIERGACLAGSEGFIVTLSGGRVTIPLPRYVMPRVAKLSAGYFAQPSMDLIDLFVGAEGTLGVVTAATLRTLPVRPESCLAFVTFREPRAGYACAAALRDAAHEWRNTAGASGCDVAAIEHMDARCLSLLREGQVDRSESVPIPADARLALLIATDLPPGTTGAAAYDELSATGPQGRGASLRHLSQLLDEHDVLARTEIAVPGDRARTAQLLRVREAVPTLVNQRVRQASVAIDDRIEKMAADVVVPFEQLPALEAFIDTEFSARRLDGAVWGHLSDGNLHPNVIARSFAELECGRDVMLAIGREAIRLGGAPLAEHGVGRNRIKQQLLSELYGFAAIDEMRRVKASLDPGWKLAPGVIFPR